MLNIDLKSYSKENRHQYKTNVPFQHIVIDDFFKEDYLEILYADWTAQLPAKFAKSLNPPPERGELDINEIANSKYFFS